MRGTKILWMWRVPPTRRRHNKPNQSQISSFDSAVLSCTSESFKMKEARKSTMARKDHWKATDAKKGARKHNDHPSILSSWQNDEQYRISQLAIGWTETYCRYLDYLTTIDTSHHAPYHQRSRYESTITMKKNDPNPQSGPVWKRE